MTSNPKRKYICWPAILNTLLPQVFVLFNLCWCALSMLTLKGIVNLAMITFFELTDQIMRSGSWCYFRWKRELPIYVSNNVPVHATIKQCLFVPIPIWSFWNVLFFNKLYTCFYIWNFIGSFTTHFYNPSNYFLDFIVSPQGILISS